ncbi:MAG: AAA domain-containing protein [Candidatus Moranbacteria bacterium]|nr:AAA domain-containing protein [Candidatus Moranbacteria bacterium]
MNVNDKKNSELISCQTCQGAGWINSVGNPCPDCKGKGYFETVRGVKLYWGKEIRGIPPLLRKSVKKTKSLFEILTWGIGILFFTIGGINLFDSLRAHSKLKLDLNLFFDVFFAGFSTSIFWLAITIFGILYFSKKIFKKPKPIDLKDPKYNFILSKDFSKEKKPSEIDISQSADRRLIIILQDALDLAFQNKQQPNLVHLVFALLKSPSVYEIFKKLEIPIKEFIQDLAGRMESINLKKGEAILNQNYKIYLLSAFWHTAKVQGRTIKPQNLLFAAISDPRLKPVLNKYSLQKEDFENIALWNKYKNIKAKNFLSKSSFDKPPHLIMNKSWSAIQTKTLDRFSTDITDYARVGRLLPLVNREDEMRLLIRILQRSSKNNVLLIGEEGSGRDSMVRGLATRIVKNKVPSMLFDKRVVKLNLGKLGSGDGNALKARIEEIMIEVVRTQNVIIYIPNIHELAKVQSFTNMDILSFLTPLFSKNVIQVIGATEPKNYHKHIEPRGDFAQTFDNIKIEELSKEKSLQVLSIQIPLLEKSHNVKISYNAAEEAIDNSKQFIPDRLLPQKAIDIISEAIVRAKNVKGSDLVTKQEVLEVFSEKTGIPVTKINRNEAEELLHLEEKISKKVVGQPRAVKNTASAIRRMRVRIGEQERPIAVFMFLGPTGVGKTELSKTLAEIYFGARDKMIRIDMSEFATPYDLERLIGDSSGNLNGLLTEKVRKNPFSLVLLDEFEKAHSTVWDLFLQIFDDGRITDGKGRVINFTNTIIIATSNVGAKMIISTLNKGGGVDEIKPYLKNELLKIFRPEFLNRFDDIIIFNALTLENIKEIARIEINKLNKRLEEEQGITVKLTDPALKYLAKIGHSPEFGARFLKRTIREKIEDALVVGILKKQYQRGSQVIIDKAQLAKKENESINQ